MGNANINKVLNDKSINIVAIAIPVAVAVLLGVRVKVNLGEWTGYLPHINAVFNSLTALFLLIGLGAIKKGNIPVHRACMLICVGLGTLFLICYILYHFSHASTAFGGTGAVVYVYYTLLLTHIILAAVVVYFVLKALYYALNGNFDMHKKTVKWGYPIWLYVSVSGVLVYLMISPYYSH